MRSLRERFRGAGPRDAAITLLAAVGAWYLSNLDGTYFVDEIVYARTGWAALHGDPYRNPTHIFAPLAKYAIGIGQVVLGRSEVGARAPVAVLGVLALVLTYRLGTRLDDRLTGALALGLAGTTYFFATFAVAAMLDVPLAFFVVATTLAAVVWAREGGRLPGAMIGVAAAGTVTAKATGFAFALPIAAAVAAVAARRHGVREFAGAMAWPTAGGLAALGLVYLPYLLTPHPYADTAFIMTFVDALPFVGIDAPVSSGTVFMLARDLYAVPALGSVAYVFTVAVVENFAHLGRGHAIMVGSRVYQYPPAWTYLVWLYERGGLPYLGALALAAGGGAVDASRGRADRAILWTAIVVPLGVLSYMTVKFPRYAVPLVPLLAVAGVLYGRALAARVVDALGDRGWSRRGARRAVALVVLLAVLVPPSPLLPSVLYPATVDTGYDEAAAAVEGYAADHPGDTTVVSYHGSTLDHYLDDEGRAIELIGFRPVATAGAGAYGDLQRRMERGEVDLVVTIVPNERARGTAINRYVHRHGRPVASIPQWPRDSFAGFGERLVVLELNASR